MASLSTRDDVCHSPANSDLYGLGIRLGFYFQMIAFAIGAKRGVASGPRGTLLDSINITLLATFIAIIRETATNNVGTVDLYIADNLIFTQINTALFSPEIFIAYRVTSLVVATLSFGIRIFYAWFWYTGIDRLRQGSLCPDDYGFFFARVSLYGWFRTFWMVLSFLDALFAGLTFLTAADSMIPILGGSFSAALISRIGGETAYKRLGQLIYIIFPLSLITTECSVYWNHLDGAYSVDSVGQLVPLILGLGLVVYMLLATTAREEIREKSLAQFRRAEQERERWQRGRPVAATGIFSS